jgi:hypothetical protein
MKYSKLLVVVSFVVLFGMTAAYAGNKGCKNAEKKCSTAVKACKDVNDANAVKGCAAKRQNIEKCNAQAASKGQKKGWFKSMFGKKDAAETQNCSKNEMKKCVRKGNDKGAKACDVKAQGKCKKECAAKCKKAADGSGSAKCMKNCKKAKACPKPAEPNAPAAK